MKQHQKKNYPVPPAVSKGFFTNSFEPVATSRTFVRKAPTKITLSTRTLLQKFIFSAFLETIFEKKNGYGLVNKHRIVLSYLSYFGERKHGYSSLWNHAGLSENRLPLNPSINHHCPWWNGVCTPFEGRYTPFSDPPKYQIVNIESH